MKRIKVRSLVPLAVLCLVLAACGGTPAPPSTNQPTAAPVAPPTAAPATAPTSAPATPAAEQPTAAAAAPTEAAAPTAAEQPTAAPSPTPIVIVDPNAVKADPNKVQIRW